MKKFCEFLRELIKNIDFEKKKMILLTNKELKITKMQKFITFAEKEYDKSSLKINIIEKLEIIAIMQINKEVQHIVFVV